MAQHYSECTLTPSSSFQGVKNTYSVFGFKKGYRDSLSSTSDNNEHNIKCGVSLCETSQTSFLSLTMPAQELVRLKKNNYVHYKEELC
jgi:hypothetical protein